MDKNHFLSHHHYHNRITDISLVKENEAINCKSLSETLFPSNSRHRNIEGETQRAGLILPTSDYGGFLVAKFVNFNFVDKSNFLFGKFKLIR